MESNIHHGSFNISKQYKEELSNTQENLGHQNNNLLKEEYFKEPVNFYSEYYINNMQNYSMQQLNTQNINKNIDKFEIINKNYKQEIDNNNNFKITSSSFKQQIDKNNTQNNNKDKTNSKQIKQSFNEKFKLTKEYFEEQTRIINNAYALTPDKLIRNCSFLEYQKDEIFQKAEISNKLDDRPLAEKELFSGEYRMCNTSYNSSSDEELSHLIMINILLIQLVLMIIQHNIKVLLAINQIKIS